MQREAAKARFSGFELNLRSGELVKDGRRLRLQKQPFRLLQILLDKSGEVVTRDELQQQLWPGETFGDFDHGLNKAIAKLRDAVDASETESSIIETLPRRGYRLNAAVEWTADQSDKNGRGAVRTEEIRQPRLWLFSTIAATVVLFLIIGWLLVRRPSQRQFAIVPTIHSIAVLPLVNLSKMSRRSTSPTA